MHTMVQALRKTVGNDPVAALDWLCLNVPEAELSRAFEPRQRDESVLGKAGTSAGTASAPKRQPFGRPLPKSALAAVAECRRSGCVACTTRC